MKQHKQAVHTQTYQPPKTIQVIIKLIQILQSLIKTSIWVTFIGRSSPDEDVCNDTPRSADPAMLKKKQSSCLENHQVGIGFVLQVCAQA